MPQLRNPSEVAEAIDRLRNEGFELELTLKMEIGASTGFGR